MSVRERKAVRLILDAMPSVQQFHDTVVVIKYGGAAMTSEHLGEGFAADVILLRLLGMRPVVVHGGGPEISRLMRRLGIEPTFVDGLRVTDGPTMEAVEMALVGKVNKKIVRLINRQGGLAVGLCGEDGRLLEAEPEDARDDRGDRPDLGFVGSVKRINTELLELLMPFGIPVIASVGEGPGGEPYNINADLVAGALAVALGAEKVVFLTDVAGVFDDACPEQPWLAKADLAAIDELRGRGAITGGMLPKLDAVRRALEGGVARAHVMDGRVEHALLRELLTDDSVGTTITR
jgi:acetylglutamate kinase